MARPIAYLQLAQTPSRTGGQTLAINIPSSPDLQRVSTAEMRLSGTGCVVSSIRPLATAAASWAGPPPTASRQSRPWQPTGRQPTGKSSRRTWCS